MTYLFKTGLTQIGNTPGVTILSRAKDTPRVKENLRKSCRNNESPKAQLFARKLSLRLFLGLVIAFAVVMPLQVSHVAAAPPTCVIGGNPNAKPIYLNPAGISDCLEENHAGPSFSWIISTWKWSLSVVNIFAVLVLVFMAFANILYPWKALEPYRIRQLLPNFIAGIILANASLLIVRAVTNVSDILMATPGIQPTAERIWGAWGIDFQLLKYGVVQAVYGEQGLSSTIGGMVYQFLLSMVLVYLPIIALLLLALFFYVRFAVIFVLTAVAPLAFASIIFPPTKKFLTQWWGYFSKWTFGGIIAYLLMFLAIQVKGDTSIVSSTAGIGVAGANEIAVNFIPYGISIVLFFTALVAPFKMGNFMAAFNRAKSLGLNSTKFLGKQAISRGWAGYGNLMGIANKYGYASTEKRGANWKSPARELIEGRSKNKWLRNPLGRALGYAGVAAGHASKYNLYNARELMKTKSKGWERIRMEGSWQNRLTDKLAGAEEAMRYWILQDKDFYAGSRVPDVETAIRKLLKDQGLSEDFLDDLEKTDPENYRLLKGSAGDRWRAATTIQAPDGRDGTKSMMDFFKESSSIEDFAKVTIGLRQIDSTKEMLGQSKKKDEFGTASDEAAAAVARDMRNKRSAVGDIPTAEIETAIADAIRTAAGQVNLTPPAGFAPGAIANSVLNQLRAGHPALTALDQRTIDQLNKTQKDIKNAVDKVHDDTKTRVQHTAATATAPADQRPLKDGAMEAWKLVRDEHLAGATIDPNLANTVTGQASLVNQLKEMQIKLKTAQDGDEKAQIVNNTFTASISSGSMTSVTKDNVDAAVARLTKSAHALEFYAKEAQRSAPSAGAAAKLISDLK